MSDFPTSVDSFPDASDLSNDSLATKPHSNLHEDLGSGVAAVQTKVGVDGSADTDSHDYKIAQLEAVATGLAETIRDTIGTALTQGSNITITVNDPSDTITIAVSGLTSSNLSDFAEAVDDRVGTLLVAGNNIDVTYNDGAGTITIDVESLTSADVTDFSEAVDDRLNAMLAVGSGLTKTYDDNANTLTISFTADMATQAELDAHINDSGDAHDASAISISDSGGYYTATDVEAALQELGDAADIYELAGLTIQVATNRGVSSFAPTTSHTTLWTGTKYDIPANSLAVGDRIQIVAQGFYANDSGGTRNLGIEMTLDGTVICSADLSGVGDEAVQGNKGWRLTADLFIDAIGSSGTINASSQGAIADLAFGVQVGQEVGSAKFLASTVNTTQALTLDVLGWVDVSTATQALACEGISVVKFNAP